MEDILASIRKILNEDDAGKAPGEIMAEPHHLPGSLPEAAHSDDVLMLDESMMVPADPPSPYALPEEGLAAGTPLAREPMGHEPALPQPSPPQSPQPGPVPPGPVPPGPTRPEFVAAAPFASEAAPPVPMPPPAITTPLATPLVGPAAAGAASGSVEMLMRTLARERTTATHRGGPTIEDLVREEMRPLLREWLDTHLPPLVERLVRAEIERVVNRMSS